MGGLRTRMPLAFWTFLIGAASLSALPLVTAGFYSKDKILWDVWSSPNGAKRAHAETQIQGGLVPLMQTGGLPWVRC